MHILGLVAENVKKIRVVEIEPKSRLVKITGKNGQGKTSVLDSIWYALGGKHSLPDKPVRKGADRAKIKLTLGTKEKGAELTVQRTIQPDKTVSLQIEAKDGKKFASPQAMLDEMMGALTFDPMQFVTMKPKEQVDALREVVKLGSEIDELNAANTKDFDERRNVNREVERLRTEAAAIVVQDGLPKEKQDESEILAKLTDAGTINEKARKVDAQKAALLVAWNRAKDDVSGAEMRTTTQEMRVIELEKALGKAREDLENQREELKEAKADEKKASAAWKAAPEGELVDVSQLTAELQKVQLANREIEKRSRREGLEKQLKEKQRVADRLTRQMEDREEKKRNAIGGAKMPLPDLTFNEDGVLYKGIPLDQAGEAEQLRVSIALAMAANPKLRILRVMHGEALDDDAMEVLAEMAEEHDFQVWMAKVDSTGKVGIVMEDGMVKAEAEDEG